MPPAGNRPQEHPATPAQQPFTPLLTPQPPPSPFLHPHHPTLALPNRLAPCPAPPQQINAHQADFLRMVMEPGEEGEDDEMAEALAAMAGGEGGLPPGMIAVELTPEDEAAIQRLEALGFDRSACIEAYIRLVAGARSDGVDGGRGR